MCVCVCVCVCVRVCVDKSGAARERAVKRAPLPWFSFSRTAESGSETDERDSWRDSRARERETRRRVRPRGVRGLFVFEESCPCVLKGLL